MNRLNDSYTENDKFNAPFLLAASFQGLIQFLGTIVDNRVLYYEFSPKNKAQELINQLRTKTEPKIPAKDLFEAIETFWKQVNEVRDERNRHGGTENR